jgi:hypothetical protein
MERRGGLDSDICCGLTETSKNGHFCRVGRQDYVSEVWLPENGDQLFLGILNHATTNVELKPGNETAAKPYGSAVFTAEVGDFLNEIKRDCGQGPVSDPTYFNTSVVQAIGTGP